MTPRKTIIKNALSCNNLLNEDYLEKYTTEQIINFCHPLDRADLKQLL